MPEWDVLASKAVGIDDIGLNIPQSTQPAKDVNISSPCTSMQERKQSDHNARRERRSVKIMLIDKRQCHNHQVRARSIM